MADPKIWWRQFIRSDQPDKDTIADAEFRKNNFTDFFGQFLQQGSNTSLQTFDAIVSIFWNQSREPTPGCKISIFVVADGAFVPQTAVPGGWFDPHVRLVAAISPLSQPASTQPMFFVVGPSDVKAPNTFLQTASWDGTALRFYGVDSINGSPTESGWVYQGNSFDAFSEDPNGPAYQGPFDGHVNGATIMKELHTLSEANMHSRPWYHWLSGENGNFLNCISESDQKFLEGIPYLTAPGQDCFIGAAVRTGDQLEPLVEQIVTSWYFSRLTKDFATPNSDPSPQPTNVHRWMAHLLLTTTVNFATSSSDGSTLTAPVDHFYNNELFGQSSDFATDMLPDLSQFTFSFDINQYKAVQQKLRISLLQEARGGQPVPPSQFPRVQLPTGTLGGGKETDSYNVTEFVEALPNNEGVPFVILQTAYEDAQGVLNMQQLSQVASGGPAGLLSTKAVKAILMLDFWNPVYSWRRGVLMEYLPASTKLVAGPKYDLEDNFVAAIRASSFAKNDNTSPEAQFIGWYDKNSNDAYQTAITNYLTAVCSNLRTEVGLESYLRLAESRRRIFRPLPLDEFGVQLPYALNISPDSPLIEMDASGNVQPIPTRGLEFINTWTGTLHGYNPEILPSEAAPTPAKTSTSMLPSLPRANSARCPVTTSVRNRVARSGRCPMGTKPETKTNGIADKRTTSSLETDQVADLVVPSTPTWQDDIYPLFKSPSWVKDPRGVGETWHKQMCYWSPPADQSLHLDLWDRQSVARNAITVYQHLRSRSMPITSDPTEYWPEEALETFRLWANQGFRDTTSDPMVTKVIIAPPIDPPMKMRVRQDLLSLSVEELQMYRAKLDDVLKVGELGSKWQELGFLHAEWCLHYQEGFALWHRAYLKYVEELIDFPMPYWNCYAAVTSDPTSEHAGIPHIFLEETYTHPDGSVRPNPLKYALAANGLNKLGNSKYVERFPVLVNGPSDPGWATKVRLFDIYHGQIAGALAKPAYSVPEGDTGYPWANLPAFTDNQKTSWYPDFARQYFDGCFEQPHDNYHGWIGPDMADNTYTAFDPIFLSYHCNIDRILEMYLRAGTRQFTSSFPLRPFINNGVSLAYSDPREYVYTTIGDMAKPSQANHYLYGLPVLADYQDLHMPLQMSKARGGTAIQLQNAEEVESRTLNGSTRPKSVSKEVQGLTPETISETATPYIIFPKISCLETSFQIDVFVLNAKSHEPDPVDNPDFVGRMTRLGMGPGRGGVVGLKNRGRCAKSPIARLLDGSRARQRLSEAKGIELIVTDLSTHELLPKEKWEVMPAFEAHLLWS